MTLSTIERVSVLRRVEAFADAADDVPADVALAAA